MGEGLKEGAFALAKAHYVGSPGSPQLPGGRTQMVFSGVRRNPAYLFHFVSFCLWNPNYIVDIYTFWLENLLADRGCFFLGHFHSKASSGDDISSTVGSQEKKSLYTFVYYIYIIIYTGVFCGWWGDGHPRTLTKFGVKTCRVSGWSDFELVRPIDVDFVTDPRLAASD